MCTAIPWKAISKCAALSEGKATALTELKTKCFAPRHTSSPCCFLLYRLTGQIPACNQACCKCSRSLSIVWAPAKMQNCCGPTILHWIFTSSH